MKPARTAALRHELARAFGPGVVVGGAGVLGVAVLVRDHLLRERAGRATEVAVTAVVGAAVLGVDATLLTGLVGEGTGEQSLAGHVNTALWGAGWGSYLRLLDDLRVLLSARRLVASGPDRRGHEDPRPRGPRRRPEDAPAQGGRLLSLRE